MNKKLLVAASAVLGVVLLSGFAGRGHHGWGRHDPARIKQFVTWKVDDRLEDLDATDAQKKAIHSIKDRLLDDGQRLMQEQQGARAAVVEQLRTDKPDAKALHAMVDARIDALRAFAHQATDAALEAHQVLTPEQRKVLADEFQERMNGR
ncbi:periplasmic heavy metal sensor [Myxococcaceae bacterium GXIMD 01537]